MTIRRRRAPLRPLLLAFAAVGPTACSLEPAQVRLYDESRPPDASSSRAVERAPVAPVDSARSGMRVYNAVPGDGTHEVLRGDTVYAISRRYGVPVRALIAANALKPPYTLRVGDSVRVPTPRVHRVARGETLYAIARRYELSVTELVRLNGLTPPYGVNADETLLLPESVDPQLAAVPPQPKEPAEPETDPGPGEVPDTPAAAAPAAKKPASAAIPQPPARSSGRFLWPLKGPVVSGFGPKGKGLHNDGINIASPRGTPVLAAENGVVAYAGNELQGFGNLVLLQHADGYMTAYAHADAVLVERGATVQRGQIIARVGSTGSVDSPQLHFEIRRGRRPVDPTRYLGTQTASN